MPALSHITKTEADRRTLEALLARHDYMIVVPASVEEFFELTEPKADYYQGYIYMHSPASRPHEAIQSELNMQLRQHIQQKGLAYELYGPNLLVHFDEQHRFMPDLTLIRQADADRFPIESEFHGVPALVVEVLSPGTRHFDLGEKRAVYRQAGVPELWFYDPAVGELTADRRQADGAYSTQVLRSGSYKANVPEGLELGVPLQA
jgi:Uma2 family endonuclease